MKKKVFRERYNMVNGDGEVVKENLTLEEIKEIIKEASANESFENAMPVNIEIEKPKRRGRPKRVTK